MFKFRLQSVLTLRERVRDEAADSLRQAHLAAQKLRDQVDQLQGEVATQSALQAQASTGVINTQKILESQRYQLHLLGQINSIRNNIALIEQECERRKSILVKREQEVKALEKLQQAQLEQWQHNQLVAQQSRLDEWASFRFWKDASNQIEPTSSANSEN